MVMETDSGIVKWFSGCLLFAALLPRLSHPAMTGQGPVEVLQAMTQALVEIVRNEPEVIHDMTRLRAIANDIVLPRVDLNALSRLVLGKNWRTATPQQRTDFIVEFREMMLGSYLRSVSAYRDNEVRFMPLRGGLEKGLATVNAEVDQTDGPSVDVMFRMRRVEDEWLIYDVAVEGISLVATHRASFSREIHSHGMDSLIERLRSQNMENATLEARTASGVVAE